MARTETWEATVTRKVCIPMYLDRFAVRENGRSVTFRPNGNVELHRPKGRATANPVEELELVKFSARIFVGLSVGDEPRWTARDIVRFTRKVREGQGHDPDASFISQLGLFTGRNGKVVEEESVQIAILNFDDGVTKAAWRDEMGELAVLLCEHFEQEVVYAELQKLGQPYQTLKATPRERDVEDVEDE